MGIIFFVGCFGIFNLIMVFLFRFRKEVNENIVCFKVICVFCNVLCVFILFSCNVSKLVCDMVVILWCWSLML